MEAMLSKVIQDKISPEQAGKTMHHTVVEGPLNCLSVNRDCSQVVVAGRNVFKVFTIEDNKFVERYNLRVGRNLNLNFSASDVTWNPLEDHILASAATNGAVVTWNLNRTTRTKQDHVFTEHKRSVNRVVFHANEHNLLMSGAQDGYMKLFDLRHKVVSTTFSGKSEPVRDVQFCPHQYFMFAAAFENGNVQQWDMRNPSRWERQFTAHRDPVFSIDWHPDPERKSILATAGRDKMIKVWDLQGQSGPRNTHQVQTIASVHRIKWRPQRRYHIASCALIVDFSISVWDIRRPYIPFAAFTEHKDVVKGIVWKHDDPHVFFSSSYDCTVYKHLFRDATRPADKANPVVIDVSPSGHVTHAANDKLINSSKGTYTQTKTPFHFKRGPDRTEQFTMVTSVMHEFETDNALSMSGFLHCAQHYQLTGKPIGELCEHNACVALEIHNHEVAQTWRILKLFYGETSVSSPSTVSKPFTSHVTKQDSTHKDVNNDKDGKADVNPLIIQDKRTMSDRETKETLTGDTSTCVTEDDSDPQEGDATTKASLLTNLANANNSHSDIFFGEANLEQDIFDDVTMGNLNAGQEWSLPNEAFQPRFDFEDDRGESPDNTGHQGPVDSPSSANDDVTPAGQAGQVLVINSSIKQELLSCPPFLNHLPSWQSTDHVCQMLQKYAERGDVQTAVAAVIVLGDKIRGQLDVQTHEHWLMGYIDLLGRFQLWSKVTEVIKVCGHRSVSQLNLRSTIMQTNCSQCSKSLQRAGWLCDRCKNGAINTCSICHHPVKGLYVWCQGCSHGGHLEHMRTWFSQSRQCPTGCGHECEYS